MRKQAVAVVALAAMLVVPLAATATAQGHRFSDVPPDHGAFEAIEWAAESGVTLGYGDGTFRPGLPMHRDHAVLFVERFYDDVLQAAQSPAFTRADMMLVLHAINNGSTFKAVSAGGLHSCGLRTDNTITCWGDNTRWATPPPTPTGHTEAPEGSFHAVSVGRSHSCGLRTDNSITCWGSSWEGQANGPVAQLQSGLP